MTTLERRYRRLLAWYPWAYRQEHEDERLGGLLAGAAGRRRPGLGDSADLMLGGLRMRARYAARSFPESDLAEALAVVLLLVPVLLLPGAAAGLHEVGWWLRHDRAPQNVMLTFPAAPLWGLWLVAGILGLLRQRRAEAVVAVLAGVLLTLILSFHPQDSLLVAQEVTPWVLLALLGVAGAVLSPGARHGLSRLGIVRLAAVTLAAAVVVVCWGPEFRWTTPLWLLPGVVLLAVRPATPTGRWVVALLALPGTAYLITLRDARTDRALSYGLSAAVAAALVGLLCTVAQVRQNRGSTAVE